MTLRKHLLVLGLLILSSCKSTDKEVMWEPDVYTGMPDRQHIQRDKDTFIKADDKRFADYMCMHKEDVKRMFSLCLEKSK